MTGVFHYALVSGVVLMLSVVFSAFVTMGSRSKKVYLTLSLGFLAFLSMFHSLEVGNDTAMYANTFLSIASAPDVLSYVQRTAMEPGYELYNYLLSRVSHDPQILFVVTGAFVYYSLGRFLYRNSDAPGLIVYALVTMLYFDTYLSALRQTIAIAITLFSYELLKERRPGPFVAVVALAATFHYSSLILLAAYPLARMKPTAESSRLVLRVLWLAALVVFMAVGLDRVLSIVLVFFPKYSYYNGSAVFGAETQVSVFLEAGVYALMYVIPRLLDAPKVANGEEGLIRQRFAVVNIILLFVSANASVTKRLAGYYSPFALLDFAHNVSHADKASSVIITVLTLVLLFVYGLVIVVLRTPEWYTTYPFSFCFWS